MNDDPTTRERCPRCRFLSVVVTPTQKLCEGEDCTFSEPILPPLGIHVVESVKLKETIGE